MYKEAFNVVASQGARFHPDGTIEHRAAKYGPDVNPELQLTGGVSAPSIDTGYKGPGL